FLEGRKRLVHTLAGGGGLGELRVNLSERGERLALDLVALLSIRDDAFLERVAVAQLPQRVAVVQLLQSLAAPGQLAERFARPIDRCTLIVERLSKVCFVNHDGYSCASAHFGNAFHRVSDRVTPAASASTRSLSRSFRKPASLRSW